VDDLGPVFLGLDGVRDQENDLTRDASDRLPAVFPTFDATCSLRAKGSQNTPLLTPVESFWEYPMYIREARRHVMQVQVARWGNSLGVRIPKQIAERAGLREGTRVEIEADGDRIVITRARRRYLLAELLQGMSPEAMREAFDWGPDRGREIID
jgi:antitoxin MazE